MTVMEKVRETTAEWKEELKDTVEHLKEELDELKGRVARMAPFRNGGKRLPVRREPGPSARRGYWPTPLADGWTDPFWPGPWSALRDGPGAWFDDDLFGGWPQVDVSENDDGFEVRAELAGVEPEDLDVSVQGNTLTIRGEKRSATEERGRDHYRAECFYGSFRRSIPLPREVDRDGVEAEFRKGVLTVSLPKTGEARNNVRRIPIHGS